VEELREYISDFPSEHTESIQFNSVVESALTLLENLIKKSTACFNVSYDPNLPIIKGHYQRLEQVIINLVQNACQALSSQDECIHVSTRFNEKEKEIVFTVEDEGCGIPGEHMERVTDLFFTTKRDIGGTGLGLAISSKIILEHEGKIMFKRGKKKGTIAMVSIPLERGSVEGLKEPVAFKKPFPDIS
jgi:polar amino acid transport system substrate-binding protein